MSSETANSRSPTMPETVTINDGGPAFPQFHDDGLRGQMLGGMTLRDYFAAKAMQGLATEINGQALACQCECESTFAVALDATIGEYSRRAYMIADAMLVEREVNRA